ncbi:hypothetical protein F4677DRAFT_435658 [Hypoxylon crocopeplum]|nr:hypothetical protein F4677DRAFT_435658 [Hypoxylon crocopeplum]
MTLETVVSLPTPPDPARLRETANLQLGSTLFGRLPLEIRDMIYAECWKASGLKQHVFIQDGHLTHSPCVVAPNEVDERLEELYRMFQAQASSRGSRTRSIVLDGELATRFSSSWHEHWRCEEEMKEIVACTDDAHQSHPPRLRMTLFMPILLTCKRTYLEARHSLYASITLAFTDVSAANKCLAVSPSTTASQLRSLAFSLALSIDSLHWHRMLNPADDFGHTPWVSLCTTLSNLVRFGSLREVTMRLGLASVFDTRQDGEGHWGWYDRWPQVHERWAMSPVRGMLARRLVLQLPRIEPSCRRADWQKPYSYPEEDEYDGKGMPFHRLERYAALPPMQRLKDGRVEIRMDVPPSPSSPPLSTSSSIDGRGRARYAAVIAGQTKGRERDKSRQTRLHKVTESVKELIAGLKTT